MMNCLHHMSSNLDKEMMGYEGTHLPPKKLSRLSIMRATSHAIKPKKNRFQVVNHVLTDGTYFPTKKDKFLEEILWQAKK